MPDSISGKSEKYTRVKSLTAANVFDKGKKYLNNDIPKFNINFKVWKLH